MSSCLWIWRGKLTSDIYLTFFCCFKKRSSILEKHPLHFFILVLFHFFPIFYIDPKTAEWVLQTCWNRVVSFCYWFSYSAASNKCSPPRFFIPSNIKGENSHDWCLIPARQKAIGLKCVIPSCRWLAYKNTKLSLSVYWLTHLFKW